VLTRIRIRGVIEAQALLISVPEAVRRAFVPCVEIITRGGPIISASAVLDELRAFGELTRQTQLVWWNWMLPRRRCVFRKGSSRNKKHRLFAGYSILPGCCDPDAFSADLDCCVLGRGLSPRNGCSNPPTCGFTFLSAQRGHSTCDGNKERQSENTRIMNRRHVFLLWNNAYEM
jgi:hypothetical protein